MTAPASLADWLTTKHTKGTKEMPLCRERKERRDRGEEYELVLVFVYSAFFALSAFSA